MVISATLHAGYRTRRLECVKCKARRTTVELSHEQFTDMTRITSKERKYWNTLENVAIKLASELLRALDGDFKACLEVEATERRLINLLRGRGKLESTEVDTEVAAV